MFWYGSSQHHLRLKRLVVWIGSENCDMGSRWFQYVPVAHSCGFPTRKPRTDEFQIKSDQGGTWLATLDCGDWHRTTQLPNVPSYTRKLQEFGSVCHGRALSLALGPLVLPCSCAGAAGAMDGDTEGAELPEVAQAAVQIAQWSDKYFKPLTPVTSSYRQKDVAISGDPKFHEMSHFLTSHLHQERLVGNTREESPRKDGIDMMETRARKLAQEARSEDTPRSLCSEGPRSFPTSPRFAITGSVITGTSFVQGPTSPSAGSQSSPSRPSEVPRARMLGKEAELQRRLQWREELDRNLRRLMTDVELGRDPAMKHYGHRMVCEQFDKRYDWFKDCGDKEVLKEQQGPPFVRYDPAKPIMAGSTRGIPRNFESVFDRERR
ncbi:unnamed protein product [Effrenium voratum]|nr:unnamed protein product [Effrenium voratum]